MDQQNFEFVDQSDFHPTPMNNLQQQSMQQVQQQLPQKRTLDYNDQNSSDAAKRQRLDDSGSYMQLQPMQQPMAAMLQPTQQMQQLQNPVTPQSPSQSMQQLPFPMTPFPSNYFYPQPMFPMQQPQQAQMQQMPSFPVTSTPIRTNGGNFTPYYPFTPMAGFPMSSFFPTPPSDVVVPSFPGTMTPMVDTQTPIRPPMTISDDALIFKEVPSALSIECGSRTKVTIGEIRRRVGAPEFLDANHLLRLTRYPKSSFRDFQRTFISHGFKAKMNAGQSISSYVMTYLLEAEAITLAKDFNKLVSTELSIPSLTAIVVSRTHDVRALLQQSEAVREHLSRVRTFLLSAGRNPEELERIEKDGAQIDPMLKKFALYTHGFGPLAVVAVIESLTQLMLFIEKTCPTQEMIQKALAPLPHLAQPSTSFNSSFNSSFDASSSFNDSGLGCSFQSTPTTTPINGNKAKKVSTAEVDLSLLSPFPNDNVVFNDSIPLRIAYDADPVSLGELRRRAYGPEKFTVSLMNSYLRKGKKTNTHNELRKTLSTHGIEMQLSKGLKPTSWSSLTETEAKSLSLECSAYLKFLPHSAEMRQQAIDQSDTACWLNFVAGIVGETMYRIDTPQNVKTRADLDLMKFALITHQFGHTFYAEVMRWISPQNLLNHQ